MFRTLLLATLIGSALFGAATWPRINPAPNVPQPITLTFVGDLMFDRYVRERAEQAGYDTILRDVRVLFASSTFVFGNLEGPITSFTPVSDYRDPGPNHFRFTFATSVAATLSEAGFSAVSLANNHIRNFGDAGVVETVHWLARANVGTFGAPGHAAPWRATSSGRAIALFGYDPWDTPQPHDLLAALSAEATSTFVVVFAHWGTEYGSSPDASVRVLAHRFVDAGADLVVGAHPHVIQGKELYRGTWIYYSLGNAVFDQYFEPRVRCGMVAHVTLSPSGTVTTQESFTELRRDGTTGVSRCGDGREKSEK